MAQTTAGNLLELRSVRQAFRKAGGGEHVVLDDVDLTLREGEIVGLLGRSGSGKSTMLRIVAGLARPSGGTANYRGQPLNGPTAGIAMVFQSFALFPWLTILENVELGLEAQGVPADERRKRALAAIDLIGLDGFESAYPKEVSGGMRQRVGFARALVVQPQILLMDEPFSALDVLTAETLRTDLLDLWVEGRMPIKSILMVTHNIEEAVQLCDRILIFSSNPGRVAHEMRVDLKHPRDRLDPAFRELVDEIYDLMTRRPGHRAGRAEAMPVATIGTPLPRISTNLLAGMIEEVAAAPYNGRAEISVLAEDLAYEIDDIFPVIETLQLLRFAELPEGEVVLTEAARRFADAEVDDRKRLFAEHLRHLPLAAHILRVLDERANHRAPFSRFKEELEDHMTEDYAERTLRAVIDWGRYAELFAYSEEDAALTIEDAA
ncbi:MAG: nitrate/sulfonate/bicarbonate ABC transporter ATP-binding protein [Alphaproteobacteria bacterium]|jgi:NitT/TauT family transport system ATP-binding protein|nr:nitrate/sulfonate/bicarbonate ABC transporter ATP-binding protein [Alphaproteobacteria bacterium]